MGNTASKSKMISVTILLSDAELRLNIQSDGAQPLSHEAVKEAVIAKYHSDAGLTEAFIEEDRLVIQWMPEHINREAEAYHQAAVEFAKRKLIDKAMANWEKGINLNPHDADYRYKLSLLLYEKKQYADAILHLERAVTLCPIHYKAHLLLGMTWLKLRKFEKAENALEDSRALHMKNMLVHLNLGAVYSVQRKFNEAIAAFEVCTELNPREARAYLGLARIYTVISDTEQANRFFRRVAELAPGTKMAEYAQRAIKVDSVVVPDESKTRQSGSSDSPSLRATAQPVENRDDQFSMGMGHYIAGQYNQAAQQYKAFLQTHPSDDYAWYLLGETLLRLGKPEEAADCFKRSIRLNDKRGLYFKCLGVALHQLGKTNEVTQVLKKAIELGKRDGLSFSIYGANLLRSRKIDDGINYLQMAIKKNPNNPYALYQLALGLVQQNETDKAKMYLDQIMAFPAASPIKDQAVKMIQTLSIP